MDFNVKTSKIINFFSQLEKKKIISQSNLAKSVLISLGMANAILKKAISKGYVKAKAAPYKRYIYYLTKEGFTVFSPKIKKTLKVFNNFKTALKPMFPGYIFINLNENMNWTKIKNTYGIKDVINFDGKPSKIPGRIIKLIKDNCDENGIYYEQNLLKKGDKVKIKKGDNFFLEGIFQESIDLNRSLILIKFLNREVKTFVQNNLLEV